jgi:hypothetical protein
VNMVGAPDAFADCTGPSIGDDCPIDSATPGDLNPWNATEWLAMSSNGGRVDEAACCGVLDRPDPAESLQPVRFASTTGA